MRFFFCGVFAGRPQQQLLVQPPPETKTKKKWFDRYDRYRKSEKCSLWLCTRRMRRVQFAVRSGVTLNALLPAGRRRRLHVHLLPFYVRNFAGIAIVISPYFLTARLAGGFTDDFRLGICPPAMICNCGAAGRRINCNRIPTSPATPPRLPPPDL
jgi:hypothetical protein